MREVARYGGDVSALVHPTVAEALARAVRAMSFRGELLRRAAARRARIVLVRGRRPPGAGRGRAAAGGKASPSRSCWATAASTPPGTRGSAGWRSIYATGVPTGSTTASTRSTSAAMPLNFGAALVALGEADGAVAGAVAPTARGDPGRPLGHRHRARRAPGELGVLHGAPGRPGADLHRLRRDSRSLPRAAGEHRARGRPRSLPPGGRPAPGRLPLLQHPGQRRRGRWWSGCGRPRPVPGARAADRLGGRDAGATRRWSPRSASGRPRARRWAAGPTC